MTRATHSPCGPAFGRSLASLMLESNPAYLISRVRIHMSTRQTKRAPIGALLVCMAEREGFEPSIRCYRIHTFQACSFNHSDTSPETTDSPSCRWGRDRRKRGARVNQMGLECNSDSGSRESIPSHIYGIFQISVYRRFSSPVLVYRGALITAGCGSAVSNRILSAIAGFI